MIASLTEAFRQGSRGAARDGTLLAGAPWGISLPEVTFTPLLFWHGELDTNVPIATTRALIETLPRCNPTYYPDDGHLSVIVNHGHEIIATLASLGNEHSTARVIARIGQPGLCGMSVATSWA
jgi:fermentation-respiration switch protein FrsA (DUF1100 family)